VIGACCGHGHGSGFCFVLFLARAFAMYSFVLAVCWCVRLYSVSFLHAAARKDRSCRVSRRVTSARVGMDNSSISCFVPNLYCWGLDVRMRREGRGFPSSFSNTRERKKGANVVRGDRPKDGIFVSIMLEEGVGMAKKDRSFWGCCCS